MVFRNVFMQVYVWAFSIFDFLNFTLFLAIFVDSMKFYFWSYLRQFIVYLLDFFQRYLPYRNSTQELFVSKYFFRASVGAFKVNKLYFYNIQKSKSIAYIACNVDFHDATFHLFNMILSNNQSQVFALGQLLFCYKEKEDYKNTDK